MPLPEQLKAQLKRQESAKGFRAKPYRCTAQKLSIGYGRNLDDDGITEDEAEYLLNNDILRAIQYANRFEWYAALDEVRQSVVANMIFNLGFAGFAGFRDTIRAIAARDYVAASKHMLNSLWASQVGRRAIELARMMETGIYSG